MRVSLLSVASVLSLVACGSPTAASVVPAPETIEELPSIVESAPTPPPDPEQQVRRAAMSAVDDLRLPSERSCLLKAPTLEAVMLRLKPDGADFAQVSQVTGLRVHVTADPVGTGLFVELDKGPVALAGIIPAENMAIYPKKPITLGGFFLPAGDTGLRITGASRGHVLLEVARTPHDLRDLTTMLRNDLPCEAASLRVTHINVRASLGKAIGKSYLIGESAPLSLTANGEPVATLVPGLSPAEILERAEGAARVAWRVDGGYVSGWVPASHLGGRPKGGGSAGFGFGRGIGGGRGEPTDRRVCKHDVPLGVRVGEDARFVGRVRAGALIVVWGSVDGNEWASVTMPAAEINTLNGASLFVRRADIDDCSRPPPKLR